MESLGKCAVMCPWFYAAVRRGMGEYDHSWQWATRRAGAHAGSPDDPLCPVPARSVEVACEEGEGSAGDRPDRLRGARRVGPWDLWLGEQVAREQRSGQRRQEGAAYPAQEPVRDEDGEMPEGDADHRPHESAQRHCGPSR